jgi:Tetratricopeptide repeat
VISGIRHRQARKLLEEALAIRHRVQGPEHPDTLTSMSHLAETLFAQGNLTGARKLWEETLDIRRRVLGPEHPDTIANLRQPVPIARGCQDICELTRPGLLPED